jgi:ferredoxin
MTFNSYLENTLRSDQSLCTNCGMCTAVCPQGVFESDTTVAILAKAEACMECGACARNCPTGAIQVESGVGCASAMIWAALTGGPVSCGGEAGCCASSGSAGGEPC